MNISPLDSDVAEQDFIGVCMGDVNGSWLAAEMLARSAADLSLGTGEIRRETAELVRVPLVLSADLELAGAQFHLNWPAGLELVSVSSELPVDWTTNQRENSLNMLFEQLEAIKPACLVRVWWIYTSAFLRGRAAAGSLRLSVSCWPAPMRKPYR